LQKIQVDRAGCTPRLFVLTVQCRRDNDSTRLLKSIPRIKPKVTRSLADGFNGLITALVIAGGSLGWMTRGSMVVSWICQTVILGFD
jgi:hypothetical protein